MWAVSLGHLSHTHIYPTPNVSKALFWWCAAKKTGTKEKNSITDLTILTKITRKDHEKLYVSKLDNSNEMHVYNDTVEIT